MVVVIIDRDSGFRWKLCELTEGTRLELMTTRTRISFTDSSKSWELTEGTRLEAMTTGARISYTDRARAEVGPFSDEDDYTYIYIYIHTCIHTMSQLYNSSTLYMYMCVCIYIYLSLYIYIYIYIYLLLAPGRSCRSAEQPARDVGRVNVGRINMFFFTKLHFLLPASYYVCIMFARSGDLYNFCCAHFYAAHITVATNNNIHNNNIDTNNNTNIGIIT